MPDLPAADDNPSLLFLRPGTVSRIAPAVLAGAAAGVVTEGLVLRVSFELVPLTKTAAPWVLVAFAVALTARRIDEAVVLAVVALLALVLGFYLAQATRGWAVSRHQVAFWLLASFGPHTYWRVQLALGIALAIGLTLWRCRRDLLGSAPALAVSLASCAVVGLATLVAYRV